MRMFVLAVAGLLALLPPPPAAATPEVGAEPAAFERDAALDRPLAALLQVPLAGDAAERLDEQLQLAFALCREHVGFSTAAASEKEPVDDRAVYCARVKFVRHHRLRFQAIRAALQAPDDRQEDDHDEIPEQLAADLSFEDFFQQFEQPQRPVVLRSGDRHPLGLSRDDLDKFLSICFGSDERVTPGGVQLRHEDSVCAELLAASGFRVPLFMAHNYLVRTDASLSPPNQPALFRLTPQSPASTVTCPHGLHSLLVSFSQSPVEFTLFSRQFEPLSGQVAAWREVAVDADSRWSWGSTAARSGGDREPMTVLDDKFLDNLPPAARPSFLPPNALLFAPGSTFAALKASVEAHVLRFCLCDASNWNVVRREAAIAALVASEEPDDSIVRLLHALQTPALDTSVSRRPAEDDARWSEYLKWPRAQKFVRKSDLVSSGALSDEQIHLQLSRRERLKQWQEDRRWDRQIASMTLPVARAPAVVNASRSSVTLRWQELLDPPRSNGGDSRHAGHGYEVRWTAVTTPSEDAVGSVDVDNPAPTAVNVTYDQLKRSRRRSTLFGDDFDGRDLEFAVRGLEPETSYVFTVRLVLGDDLGGESPASRSVRTGPCAPPSRPRGVPVVTARPNDNPTCVTLRWIDPRDDGGRRIEQYVVASTAFVDERLSTTNRSVTTTCRLAAGDLDGDPESVRDGERVVAVSTEDVENERVAGVSGSVPWRSARVCALLPATAYRFRVAASNALGAGQWSQSSSCVATGSPNLAPPPLTSSSSLSLRSSLKTGDTRRLSSSTELVPALLRTDDGTPTLRGRGDPLYEIASALTRGRQADSRYPLVVLSDMEQTLVVVANGTHGVGDDSLDELELWAGHFSPRSFRVSAQLVRADPVDASSPLRNAAEVKDRVVLMTRGGGVPLAVKTHFAQLAGALGVVIADMDDRCGGRFDQRCVPGADRARREGFAAQDRHALWTRNGIPCALVLRDAGQRLLAMLS